MSKISKGEENKLKVNDYIALQEGFRSGNYEYETISSMEHLFVAYKNGKKNFINKPDRE